MKKNKHVPKPKTAPETAPNLFTFLLNNPQINGPKNTEAIAPQEMERIVTITAGFINARAIDSKMKKMLLNRTVLVKVLSEASLLIKPL